MNYQIKKIQPAVRPQKPRWHHSKHIVRKSLVKQPSSISTGDNQSPERIKLKAKESIQTIMMAKSTYVEKLNISSTSWLLFDSNTGRKIGFRQRHQRQIASLTKIMTTILAIELFQHFQIPKDCYVRVTEQAAKMIGTSAQLKSKVWIAVWDLLYGAMLPSGNDAAHLLSEVLGYFSKTKGQQVECSNYIDLTNENTNPFIVQFVRLMNRKAQQLQLFSTTFSNPHGLQNAMNTSCPRDMITLCQYVSKNEKFREVMNSNYFRYYFWQEKKDAPVDIPMEEKLKNHAKCTRRSWWNTNSLLKKGWEGIKTGQTGAAGSCLASLKKGIYIVVLNCKDNEARFNQTQKIYEWYCEKKLVSSDDETDGDSL